MAPRRVISYKPDCSEVHMVPLRWIPSSGCLSHDMRDTTQENHFMFIFFSWKKKKNFHLSLETLNSKLTVSALCELFLLNLVLLYFTVLRGILHFSLMIFLGGTINSECKTDPQIAGYLLSLIFEHLSASGIPLVTSKNSHSFKASTNVPWFQRPTQVKSHSREFTLTFTNVS